LVTQHPRRRILSLAAGAAALPAVSRISWAQAYPSRLVRLVVGYPAAGANDIFARLIAGWLSKQFGRSFIVENRPGAASNITTEAVVRAPADGYTLLVCGTTNAVNETLSNKLNFDFIRDIAPVAGLTGGAYVMVVHPSFPAKTVPEFIAYAKVNPGRINMASVGTGSTPHVVGELFKLMAGVNLVHVPYRTSPFPDLLGGQGKAPDCFQRCTDRMGFIARSAPRHPGSGSAWGASGEGLGAGALAKSLVSAPCWQARSASVPMASPPEL
jgi:tripartite-type tricarboxylate transporter receptor subunit TctC